MNQLFFNMHIMWYESHMISETLDSLQIAIENSPLPVRLTFCLNTQTYIETPVDGDPVDMFAAFLDHPIMQRTEEVLYRTNDDPFYNIGDWRRQMYDDLYKYTIWGESDCLVPPDYFYILSLLDIDEPHVVSLASRKMGDNSWAPVEMVGLDRFPRSWPERTPQIPQPFHAHDRIGYEELCQINDNGGITIVREERPKIDGALLALSPGLPQLIPDDMHFAREDFCANMVLVKRGIPQYVIKNRIKGHNYRHPDKRRNTDSSRSDDTYKKYESESLRAMQNFLQTIN